MEMPEEIKGTLSLSAATVKSEAIQFPLMQGDYKAAVIKSIEIEYPGLDTVNDQMWFSLGQNQETSEPNLSDSSIYDKFKEKAFALGTLKSPLKHDFYPGIPVARQKLYVTGYATDAMDIHYKITYVIRRINAKQLYNAMF